MHFIHFMPYLSICDNIYSQNVFGMERFSVMGLLYRLVNHLPVITFCARQLHAQSRKQPMSWYRCHFPIQL